MISPAAVTLAHGVASREDLPIPFHYALVGAGAALVVSFAALGLFWRRPRLPPGSAGHPLPPWFQSAADAPATRLGLRGVGLALATFTAVAALRGPDSALNPAPGMVYVLFWAGLVPASLLLGPVWRLLNPLRALHTALATLTRIPPEGGLCPYPRWLGYWPAAAGLLAFTWLELVAPQGAAPWALSAWCGGYAVVQSAGALVFGRGWFARADAFEVFSDLVGRLSPLGRRGDARLVLRNPFAGMATLGAAPGVVAVVAVMLGTTAYDSLSNAPWWIAAVWENTVRPGALSATQVGTAALVAAVVTVAALLMVGARAATLIARRRLPRPAADLAHTIVPIAVGYFVAHYFSLLVFEGQRTLALASDPLGTGANLFGTAHWQVDYSLPNPTAIAVVQVVAIVCGHIAGVVCAHDRALVLFPGRAAVTSQLPLLALMVAYTVGGLTLLYAT